MSKHLPGNAAHRPIFAVPLLHTRIRLTWLLALPVVAVLVSALLAIAPAAQAQASCANPIVCENQLPGTPQSVWGVGPGEGKTIQGFADPSSVNVGRSINFKIESPASSYAVDIYRMQLLGGRRVQHDPAVVTTSLNSRRIFVCRPSGWR